MVASPYSPYGGGWAQPANSPSIPPHSSAGRATSLAEANFDNLPTFASARFFGRGELSQAGNPQHL